MDSRLTMVDSLDLFLTGLQNILDGEVFGFTLPLIGSQLAGAAPFIDTLRRDFIDPFREQARQNESADLLSLALWTILGHRPEGDTSSLPYLGLLLDENGEDDSGPDAIKLKQEVLGPDNFLDPLESFIQWNMKLGGSLAAASADVSFDLGLPGLGLETDGALLFDLKWVLSRLFHEAW